MHRSVRIAVVSACLAVALAAGTAPAQPSVGSAFTYQGSLSESGTPASGPYDLRFELYDAASGGTQMGGTIAFEDVPVSGGVFSVRLDFGSSWFPGSARWLEIGVRAGASTGPFTPLGRQELTPTPFAIGLSLPAVQSYSHALPLLSMSNTGTGAGGQFSSNATHGVVGRHSGSIFGAAGVRGEANSNTGQVIGVEGVATNSDLGTGLVGRGKATGAYLEGTGFNSTGLYALGYARGLYAENLGTGAAIFARGKGKTRSNAVLRLENTEADQGMCAFFENSSNFATAHLRNNGNGELLWLESVGTGPYIVATGPGGWKFWVDNAGVTHTKVLEILGGSDLSEKFDVRGEAEAIPPGTVVSIDPDHEGRLQVACEPYDRRVAGIISGAGGVRTGMLMGQQGSVADGDHPVALTGRVYCRATAANGPIRPGDLLTTSGLPGHAMRADDPLRAQGAVLGKAMGSLEGGEGLVLVLVGLQ
jgi:hypothetical protein